MEAGLYEPTGTKVDETPRRSSEGASGFPGVSSVKENGEEKEKA
jgi:hypothetical protein